jgi:hypothetical protein
LLVGLSIDSESRLELLRNSAGNLIAKGLLAVIRNLIAVANTHQATYLVIK